MTVIKFLISMVWEAFLIVLAIAKVVFMVAFLLIWMVGSMLLEAVESGSDWVRS